MAGEHAPIPINIERALRRYRGQAVAPATCEACARVLAHFEGRERVQAALRPLVERGNESVRMKASSVELLRQALIGQQIEGRHYTVFVNAGIVQLWEVMPQL